MWSSYQQAIFRFVQAGFGNLIIEAVAGSGKTTTLIEIVRIVRGYVMLLAYNRSIADVLQQKLAQIKPPMRGKFAGTFHSVGFSALRKAYKHLNIQVDDKKVANLFRQYTQLHNIQPPSLPEEIYEEYKKRGEEIKPPAIDDYYAFVTNAVSMAKQRGIGIIDSITDETAWERMISHFMIDQDLPDHGDQEFAIRLAQNILQESNKVLEVIDYDDMIYLALLYSVKFWPHDFVLVDEAQDTNPVRRLLVKRLLKPNGRAIFVGDPHQAIFGFTGADNDALDQIARDYDCTRLPLSVTYRCPKVVVGHARQWVSHIEAAQTAPEGEFHTMSYNQFSKFDFEPNDAILCRFNKYLVDFCFKLIRRGVPAKMEGRQIGEGLIKLVNKWKVLRLDTLRERLTRYKENEVKKALEKQQEQRADRITDQVETLFVLIERAEEKKLNVPGLVGMIREMFDDEVRKKGLVTLSSCHRAKGLEWDRVFLLGREELMPSWMARQDWQKAQEKNLIYVAVTRAKKILVEVNGVIEGFNERKKGGAA